MQSIINVSNFHFKAGSIDDCLNTPLDFKRVFNVVKTLGREALLKGKDQY
jgi:hypothetical protein